MKPFSVPLLFAITLLPSGIATPALMLFASGAVNAAAISFGTLTVPSLNPAGVSFTYSGTLTQADTIAFTQSGDPCLQGSGSPGAYCTNGAGVVVVAGTGAVGSASTFGGTFGPTMGTWDLGALLMEVSTVATVQIFPADAADGLGSATPPLGLTLPPTSLSALGFSAFSVVDPTITFYVADDLYTDNSGQFTLTQAPEPASIWLVTAALAIGLIRFKLARAKMP
jgi:hypothetical protein